MKINAKLGGRNMKLEGPPRNSYPGGIDARPFMVLGALCFARTIFFAL